MNVTNGSGLVSNSTKAEKEFVGWVVESSGRGTLSLIITSLFTIFLCTWVVIHPRVHKRRLYGTLYKLVMFIKAILAPELIAVEGLQEWTQCQRMKRDCEAYTDGNFKLVHAFYIKEEIRDKSNADSAAKLVAFCQVFWFVAQSIMRTAHGLPLSQLESMTLSYIPLFAATYFFWWLKPKDISTPTVVNLPLMSAEQKAVFELVAVSNKFDNEGLPEQVSIWNILVLTPRVFEKEAEDKAFQDAQDQARQRAELKVQRLDADQDEITKATLKQDIKEVSDAEKSELSHRLIRAQPLRFRSRATVVSHWDPGLYRSRIWPLICLSGASFGALHLISWNTEFPTKVELWLWRGAAFVSIFSLFVFMHFEKVEVRWRGPLTLVSLLSLVLYFASRIIMMGEVFAALRAENPAIYDTYVVSTYRAHLL
ncbi:uncharacterized protein PAC_06523 [Phialocephala subalpina]|uniref:Uncharacterized protein n=1 Tax=Phialocephala subalpina TaxID=576137 RepID=A0A1L7WV25_9HELO|nr:uncharacterized protein PAC_06523 [Phialocephala subalpina]